jgi:NitT/TauT family transport system substrate-binding protein
VENMSTALVQVAHAKGFFADEGIDVVLQHHASGKTALDSMLQGKADLATVADTPIMFAVLNGKKFFILADIETANRNMTIIGLRDKGIMKPADLKGKRIGVTFGTNGDYFLETFLIANRIDRRSVNVIDMNPGDMRDALAQGKIDAVSVWNPAAQAILDALEARGSVFYGDALYTETFCLAADQDFVKKNPETVKRVLRGLVKAEQYIRENGSEARHIVAQFNKTDEALIARIWDIFNFRLTLDQSILVSLENQTRWAIRSRLSPTTITPNYLNFVYSDGLQAVKPDAVMIIR